MKGHILSSPCSIFRSISCSSPGACNDADRCYHCKHAGFTAIVNHAKSLGFPTVIDGSNASDRGDYRPGMRAAEELGVRSPLMEVGFTKDEERELLRAWGYPVWNLPAGACLATRVPTGEELTREKVDLIRACEDYLHDLDLAQVRARLVGGCMPRGAPQIAKIAALGSTAVDAEARPRCPPPSIGPARAGLRSYLPEVTPYIHGNMNQWRIPMSCGGIVPVCGQSGTNGTIPPQPNEMTHRPAKDRFILAGFIAETQTGPRHYKRRGPVLFMPARIDTYLPWAQK
ncbi:MAG: hypothetical protein ACLRM9_05895 [Collinsella aerofaciens]